VVVDLESEPSNTATYAPLGIVLVIIPVNSSLPDIKKL
jgi:hypothetical protein